MEMKVPNKDSSKCLYYSKRLNLLMKNKFNNNFIYKNIKLYSNNSPIFFTISDTCPIGKSPILYYVVESLNLKIFNIGNKDLYLHIKDMSQNELNNFIKRMIDLAIIETDFNLKNIFQNAII